MPQQGKTSRNTTPARKTVPAKLAAGGPEESRYGREESIQAIADQVIVGIVQADVEGRITYANDRYCAITGYSRKELLGKHWQDITHPDDLTQNLDFFERMIQAGGPYTFEKRYIRKSGETVWISISASLVYSRRNQLLGALAIVIDISEQKKTLDELRESETKYRTLFENSRDALLTNSPPDMKFIAANRSAVQMFGVMNEAEFLSLSPADISPEFQPDGSNSAVKARAMVEVAMSRGANLFEWVHKRKDGTTFPVEVMLTRMELNRQVCIQGSLRDISERRRMQREIQERRKEMDDLQKQHVAAQTAAAIAHELNQPLLAISSYCEAALMLIDAREPNLGKIRKAIESSEFQAHRAGKSIRELLEFLSMKEFSSEAIDLNDEVIMALNTARSEHELQFRSELRLDNTIPLIRANRVHVRKVLLNLLHNGIEAMHQAGVPLPAITVTVRTAKDESVAQITIQDNGPGLNAEDIQHLFEPFFTTKKHGIGMGLTISRVLIEANGGQLWIDPQETSGATFHLTLPFHE